MSSQHPSDRTTTEPEKGLGLSAAQVVGSALAAVSAAVASSFLGVAGTIIGAALASVFATIGSAVYTASLRRGHEVVLRTGTARPTDWASRLRSTLTGLSWRRIGLGAAAALVLALGTLTALERFAGAPVSAIAQSEDGGGTTLGKVISGGDEDATWPEAPSPADDVDDVPPVEDGSDAEPTEEPTVEPTEEPTVEPTEEPTVEPTEEPTEAPAEEPTVEPTEEPVEEPTEEPVEEPAEEPAAESTP